MVAFEPIIISVIASAVFGTIVFLLGLLYYYCKLKRNIGVYIRRYQGNNTTLKNEISAIAEVWYKFNMTMKVIVTTLINEDESLPAEKHYKFPEESVQIWTGELSMDNREAGKLYWYYIKPEGLKKQFRSGFKRVLFLDNSKVLKLFGEGGFGEELFKKER